MTPDDVRALARSAPERWSELEIFYRSSHEDVRATLRHGELTGVSLYDGRPLHVVGAPPPSWSVRPLEPYATNYQWSAMLDPYELAEGTTIDEVRTVEVFGRPAVSFVARAGPGYDPICSCCPLIFSAESQQLEHGDDWAAAPGEIPDGVEMALDLAVGVVVSSRDRGGRLHDWFTNEIIHAA